MGPNNDTGSILAGKKTNRSFLVNFLLKNVPHSQNNENNSDDLRAQMECLINKAINGINTASQMSDIKHSIANLNRFSNQSIDQVASLAALPVADFYCRHLADSLQPDPELVSLCLTFINRIFNYWQSKDYLETQKSIGTGTLARNDAETIALIFFDDPKTILKIIDDFLDIDEWTLKLLNIRFLVNLCQFSKAKFQSSLCHSQKFVELLLKLLYKDENVHVKLATIDLIQQFAHENWQSKSLLAFGGLIVQILRIINENSNADTSVVYKCLMLLHVILDDSPLCTQMAVDSKIVPMVHGIFKDKFSNKGKLNSYDTLLICLEILYICVDEKIEEFLDILCDLHELFDKHWDLLVRNVNLFNSVSGVLLRMTHLLSEFENQEIETRILKSSATIVQDLLAKESNLKIPHILAFLSEFVTYLIKISDSDISKQLYTQSLNVLTEKEIFTDNFFEKLALNANIFTNLLFEAKIAHETENIARIFNCFVNVILSSKFECYAKRTFYFQFILLVIINATQKSQEKYKFYLQLDNRLLSAILQNMNDNRSKQPSSILKGISLLMMFTILDIETDNEQLRKLQSDIVAYLENSKLATRRMIEFIEISSHSKPGMRTIFDLTFISCAASTSYHYLNLLHAQNLPWKRKLSHEIKLIGVQTEQDLKLFFDQYNSLYYSYVTLYNYHNSVMNARTSNFTAQNYNGSNDDNNINNSTSKNSFSR